MKTAISIPDDTFAEAERRAKELGLNRSQFFTRAVQRYLAELEAESLTERINAALEATGGGDAELIRDVTAQGRRMLLAMDDDW